MSESTSPWLKPYLRGARRASDGGGTRGSRFRSVYMEVQAWQRTQTSVEGAGGGWR